MEVLMKKFLGRFLGREVYREKSGDLLEIHLPSNWRKRIEINADTAAALADWAPHEKKVLNRSKESKGHWIPAL
ncbi:hypothetical protein HPB48_018432 [Haemaphysalis longicornis]|uniref:Uncharacterized protein n=1 Tax=Haemaphysalis longicornis TaxID=44386 RepID=A0A9J6GE19_HAELO|nr:hypothetical protein HPB48_018432 [Haemaphysalis longicornis]